MLNNDFRIENITEIILIRQTLLSPLDSSLEGISILDCFDIQMVKTKWLSQVHHTITDREILNEVDESIRHTVTICRREEETCRHQLIKEQDYLEESLISAPKMGDVFEFTKYSNTRIGIVISPPALTAHFQKRFKVRMALIVTAYRASQSDKTTAFGVRTASIGDIGPLWAACYTATIQKLDNDSKKHYRARFRQVSLSMQDLKAIHERVLLYLGVES